jgi:hypothetical protein
MGKPIPEISPDLAEWLAHQHIFFVATAPNTPNGHVNCSPKGGEAFRVLGPMSVAYLDYHGSGAETAAHLRDNGRIVVMFCALDGSPRVARLHGRGEVIEPGHADFASLANRFPGHPGLRSIVRVTVARVSTSCGYGVPLFDYRGERDTLIRWAETKGPDGLRAYRETKNRKSIDGLPALQS